MGWRYLFDRYGAQKQLYRKILDAGLRIGDYTGDIDGVTDQLIDMGIVVKPDLEGMLKEENWLEAIHSLDSLNKDQTLIIPNTLFPDISTLEVRANWLLLKVRYNRNKPQNSAEQLKQNLQNVKLGDIYVGTDFRGVTYSDQHYKVYQIVDSIRADVLKNHISPRNVWTSGKESKKRGANTRITGVPSIEFPNRRYIINLKHIAVYGNNWGFSKELTERFNITSYDLFTTHTCDRTTWDFNTIRGLFGDERIGTQVQHCHHTIAAFRAAADKLKRYYKVTDPFYKPTKRDFQLYQLLQKNTLIETRDEHVSRRPPNLTQMEIILWNHIGYKNAQL